MMRCLAISSALFLLAALGDSPAHSDYFRPSPYKIAWELDFEAAMPKRIVVANPTTRLAEAYWYLPFVVTNRTGEERPFVPVFELLDDNGNIHRSDRGIGPYVFQAIKDQQRNALLEPYSRLIGRILVGEDQARIGVAIWPEPKVEMAAFSIFVKGLSGESILVRKTQAGFEKVEKFDDIKSGDDLINLSKTLHLRYVQLGDEDFPGGDPVFKLERGWVMR